MKRCHPRRATKIEVLKLMAEREIITWSDLAEYFGYPYQSAACRLWRLQKDGLVSQLKTIPRKWVLTEAGYRRLEYYGQF